MSRVPTPSFGRLTTPFLINSGTTRLAMLTGMAKPTPADAPEGERICELMPIICPLELSSGPPELPGLIEASV
jgi:hypothetical protein